MGSSGSSQKKHAIQNEKEQLVFYTSVDDPNLGEVRIYTSRKIPLCYILKYERKFEDTKIYNQFKKIQQLQSGSLLSMYGFRIDRQTYCNKTLAEVVTSYWEYYNFYFNDYLNKRTSHTCMFVDTEIWHIVDIVCESYSLFRKCGIFYQINPQTFVVTPEGKLKGFWSHLKSQNTHLKYIQYFDKEGYAQKFFYSPQELQYMYLQERTTKIDFDKCNSFRLGMIILSALTLTDPIYVCYNPSMTKINFNIIRNLVINKILPSYPPQIVRLVKSLLKEDPKQRPTLMEVHEMYSNYFNSEFELRVCGGKPKQSFGGENRQNEEQNDDFRNMLVQKKASDFSDVKTVKLSHSLRKA